MLRAPSRPERRLPGEKREFKTLTPNGVRSLTPPQQLTPDGRITSSREHEVIKGDPALLRIKELEAEVAALRAKLANQENQS
jgi:hypothetical protein